MLAALAAGAAPCLPAHADEAIIVVTATRQPTPTDRLPARIEVLDRAAIESRGLTDLAAALGSPAVQSGGAGQQASLFLRGTNSKHALALLDGVRLNDAAAPNGQYDFGLDTLGWVDRIEVLRGPASSVHGSDAIGGVVNLLPRRGGEDGFEPYLEIELGSHDTIRTLLGAAGNLGGLGYGLSVEAYNSDGYDLIPKRMATFADHADGAEIATATLSARNEGDVLSFDVLARWRSSTTAFDTFSGGAGFDLRADDPDLETEGTQGLWRLGGDYSLTADARVRLEGGQIVGDRSDWDGGSQISAAQSARSFVNASASGAVGALTLNGGAVLEREEIETFPQFAAPLSAAEDHSGAFLIAQADVGDRYAITGSARLDDYETFGSQTTYSLGAVALFSSLRVFASYGTAFKAPSLSERYEVSFFNVGNQDLAPERAASWEVGADWQAGAALNLGLSYYHSEIEDLIEYRFAELRNVNVGAAEISGAEAHIEFAPTGWALLRFDYAWTDAVNDQTGARLARRPEHAWSLDANIEFSHRLRVSTTWSHVGERVDVIYDNAGAFVSAEGVAPAFDVVDLALRYALDRRAELFARVENLADEVYEQPNGFAGASQSFAIGVRARY
jgi:vitamin B12 transporter